MPRFVRPPDPADPEAFDALARAWWGYCERWAHHQGRRWPGRDFASAANAALWKAAATFDPARGFTFQAYLNRVLGRAGLSHSRKGLATEAVGGFREADHPAAGPRHPDGEPDFEARLAGLRPRHAELVRLRFRDGLTLEQAGARLGVSKERARQIEARALEILRAG